MATVSPTTTTHRATTGYRSLGCGLGRWVGFEAILEWFFYYQVRLSLPFLLDLLSFSILASLFLTHSLTISLFLSRSLFFSLSLLLSLSLSLFVLSDSL